ncbi:unnamed protein product [Ectocarpus sp. 6 AP-2014]
MAGLAENMLGISSEEEGKTTRVECTTTASPEAFTLEVYHSWSPNGAERFVDLVKDDYFTDVALFRCVKNFLVQFGISPDASSPKKKFWREKGPIEDDPNLQIRFKRGMLSFAGSGPNSRGTQVFITFADIPHLGKTPWETPLGIVTQGMDTVVDKFYTGYGDQQPFNQDGINQGTLQSRGNAYLREEFPEISYLKECRVVGEMVPEEHAFARVEKQQEKPGGEYGDVLRPPPVMMKDEFVVPQAAEVAVPQTPKELAGGRDGDGTSPNQGVSFSAIVFLALALGAVVLVWKKSKKDERSVR